MPFRPIDTKNQTRGTKELRIHPSTAAGYVTAGAVREWFEGVEEVTLHVDRENSRLGIESGENGAGDTFSLTQKGSGQGAGLTVKPVLRSLDIDPDLVEDSHRIPLEHDSESDFIVGDLASLVEQYTGAVHCDVCGKRCRTEQGLQTHVTAQHDGARKTLQEMDPDDIGEPIPESPVASGGDE